MQTLSPKLVGRGGIETQAALMAKIPPQTPLSATFEAIPHPTQGSQKLRYNHGLRARHGYLFRRIVVFIYDTMSSSATSICLPIRIRE